MRIVFCLFADDTGIFEPRDIFMEFIETRTLEDGSDLGPWISQLFQVLDTPLNQRQTTIDEDLNRFPHVNGKLFDGPVPIPNFNASMRDQLLDACRFDWSGISPAIFGALFQSVMDPAERRAQGAHYTTERNILKLIEPLFMDDLKAEFMRLKSRRDSRRTLELQRLHRKLGRLTFFDPACGCGNFLIIAYREMRLLEIEVIRELRKARLADEAESEKAIDVGILSLLDVDQFHGIEIGEFPKRIAETAMWMMDHIMNNRLSVEFGETYSRIPLCQAPNIMHGDALETDWEELLVPEKCSYILGNPPFSGAKYQSPEQRAQVHRIAAMGKSGGTLDYVSAWFIKAGEYARRGHARIGFVATNSITQGEQVAQLWPILFGHCRLEIAFAHRTFAWGSDAKGKAHVHVVILGLDRADAGRPRKSLFSYPDINGEPEQSDHAALSPYLFDASRLSNRHLVVRKETAPINGMPKLITGSKPIDDGNYILNQEERAELLEGEPEAARFVRPFIGAREFLHGLQRWILALHSAPPEVLAQLPVVRRKVEAVRAFRSASGSAPTRALAAAPTLYHINVVPGAPFLVIPKVSSERREYTPIGYMEPPKIPSDLLFVLQDVSLTHFALLTSAMHMAWLRHVGGRLKSDYRYSIGLVYNTFPPPLGISSESADIVKLEATANAVLQARAEHSDATLANLYDPDLMPPKLRRAHQALDRAVDRLYRRSGFASERERVEHLFMLYERMTAPLEAKAKKTRRGRPSRQKGSSAGKIEKQ